MYNKSKNHSSERVSMLFTVLFIVVFAALMVLSIIFTIKAHPTIILDEGTTSVDWFSTQVSNSYDMNIPFSIFVQLITTIGGVFFGIRIDQWIDTLDSKNRVVGLWNRIYRFLNNLKIGIQEEKSILELAEYKIYFESVLQSDEIAAKEIQDNEDYVDICYTFSFLSFYISNWRSFSSIHEWSLNSSDQMKHSIMEWKTLIDDLLLRMKVHCE